MRLSLVDRHNTQRNVEYVNETTQLVCTPLPPCNPVVRATEADANVRVSQPAHGTISVMVMLDAMTPPKIRPPLCPLNVVVSAVFGPARTLNVVALVVPAVM